MAARSGQDTKPWKRTVKQHQKGVVLSGPKTPAMIFDSFLRHRRRKSKLTTVTSSPPSLPVELYRPIIEAVGSRNDLHNLLFVSKTIHAESERLLYREVTTKRIHKLKVNLQLFNHLSECQRVAVHVRKLAIHFLTREVGRKAEEYFRTMNKALCALHHLEQLHLDNGLYVKNWTQPPSSLLAGCTFQLKILSMVVIYACNRADLENQKYLEKLYIQIAATNSLSQVTFPRLSTLHLMDAESSPDPETIKGIKDLGTDYLSLQNHAAFQSPLGNVTSLTLWGYDSTSLVVMPHIFPSVQSFELVLKNTALSCIEDCIEHLQWLPELRKVSFFGRWIEKELPTQSVVTRWLSKLITVESIIIQEDVTSNEITWCRGAAQWVEVTPSMDGWKGIPLVLGD